MSDTPNVDFTIAYDTVNVLRGNVNEEAMRRGCGSIDSPIFDLLAAQHVTWCFTGSLPW